MEMANPLLENFRESPKAPVINSSPLPGNLKENGNTDLLSVCSNYWPPIEDLSLCFNHLVLLTFRQCRFAIPRRSAKPINQYRPHNTEPLENTFTISSLLFRSSWRSPWNKISKLAMGRIQWLFYYLCCGSICCRLKVDFSWNTLVVKPFSRVMCSDHTWSNHGACHTFWSRRCFSSFSKVRIPIWCDKYMPDIT